MTPSTHIRLRLLEIRRNAKADDLRAAQDRVNEIMQSLFNLNAQIEALLDEPYDEPMAWAGTDELRSLSR